MAFKPFEFFRKRQKLMLALITIMAMFVFVVGDALMGRSSGGGGGGPLTRGILSLFGVVPRDRVAVVGGSNLTLPELRQLATQREMAFRLVSEVRAAEQDAILRKEANFTDADFRLRESNNDEDRKRFRERIQAVQTSKPEVWRKLTETRPSLVGEAVADFEIFTDPIGYFRRTGRFPSEAESPLTAENLVSFAWWKNKADELGIVINNAKVKEELVRAGGEVLKPEDLPALVRDMQRRMRQGGIELNDMLSWLGDEIRVMIAKGTVQGQPRRTGFGTGPLSTQATPLDLWNAYVDVRTQLDVGILPIHVNQEEFLKQVPEPTEAQIKEFYTKNRSQEPDPTRDTPGFRIPKLYQVEFVYADLDPTADAGKYYHDWARAIQDLDPVAFLGEAVNYYEKNKATRYRSEDPFFVSVSGNDAGDATYYRGPFLSPIGPWLSPAAAQKLDGAQAVLGASGVLATAPAVPLGVGPAIQLSGQVVPRQREQSIELAALVGDAAATAALGMGPAGLLAYPPRLGYVEKYTPFEQAYPGIVDELTEARVQQLLANDLNQLKADLAAYGETYKKEYAKWRARPGARTDSGAKFTPPPFTHKVDGKEVSEPLDDYLKRFASARGLKLEGMKEMRSRADLFKEKETTPLGSILKPLFFETSFMAGRQFDDFVAGQLVGDPGLFQAKRVPDEQQALMRGTLPRKHALHWKRAEAEARTPPLEEIRAQVVQAWKEQKARELAEAAAKALAEKAAKEGPDGYRVLRDSKEGEYTEKTLSRFDSSAMGLGVLSYRRATIPTIENPPDDFLDQVLKTLKEPGQTMVVANKPKSTYYVLFLRERKQPRANDPLAVGQFDLQVILPSQQRQLQVEGMPISDWVLRQQYEKYQKDWEKYFKDVTRYNQELANSFKGS
jgi:hypothetical protein